MPNANKNIACMLSDNFLYLMFSKQSAKHFQCYFQELSCHVHKNNHNFVFKFDKPNCRFNYVTDYVRMRLSTTSPWYDIALLYQYTNSFLRKDYLENT